MAYPSSGLYNAALLSGSLLNVQMTLESSNLLWRGVLIASIALLFAGFGAAIWLLWRSVLRPFTRNLLLVMFGLGLFVGGLQIAAWGGDFPNFMRWFANLDIEYTLGTHFSTVQFVMIAAVTAVIGLRMPVTHGWQRLYWLVMAAGFAFMGADDFFQMHEAWFGDILWRPLYGGAGIGVVLATAWMYRRVYPRRHTAFLLLFDGLLMLAVSGIVIEYAVWQSFCYDTPDSLVPVCERFDRWLFFEEWFEITGATVVLAALVHFAQETLPPAGWGLHKRAVIGAGVLAAAGLTLYLWIMPAIEAHSGTQPVEVSYMDGRLELVSYRLGRDRAAPGETVSVQFYWRANDILDSTLRLSLHALAKPDHSQSVAQVDEINMGQYPSTAFLPGVIVRKSVDLTFPADLPTPASYSLMLRVWSGNPERQDLRGVDITQADRPLLTADSLLFDSLPAIAAQDAAIPTNSIVYDFAAEGFSLAGYTLPNTAQSGADLSLSFIWRTREAVNRELTQFVHLVDEDGQFAFGYDQAPFAGRLPTSDWPPGITVEDTWHIALPDDLPAGTYTVYTGLYDPVTLDRAQVQDASGQPVLNHAIPLGRVQITD